MIDTRERVRGFVSLQYVKMKRMASVGSLILLAVNLSFTLYPFVQHRFMFLNRQGIPDTYVGIPVLFFTIVVIIWAGAHVYVKKFEMYRTEMVAERMFNPYAVYLIGPFEEMLYRTMTIPTLEAAWLSMPEGDDKIRIGEQLDKAKKWVDLGYIPKEEYPEHLMKYYITNKQTRL